MAALCYSDGTEGLNYINSFDLLLKFGASMRLLKDFDRRQMLLCIHLLATDPNSVPEEDACS